LLAAWKRGELAVTAATFDGLHQVVDALGPMLAAPDAVTPDQAAEVTRQLAGLQSGVVGSARNAAVPAVGAEPATAGTAAVSPGEVETIRISTAKLEALLRDAEELLAVKLAGQQHVAELRQFAAGLEQWKRECAESSSPDRVRALEQQFAVLMRAAQRDAHVTGQMVDGLLEDSKKLLLRPFNTLLAILPKMVRDLCREQNKTATLELRGGAVEIDKRILEELKDPLMHLIRNGVDHGIESPMERAQTAKPAGATITVSVAQVAGGHVQLEITDDGRGIDVPGVKAAAVRRRVIRADEAQQLPYAAALALVFRSDVSTSDAVTAVSGRGLGLAIVREKVAKLGGQVSVTTEPGRGTTFRLVLPLTLATFRGLLVGVDSQQFVIPLANIVRVGRVKNENVTWLSSLLAIPRPPADNPASGLVSVVILTAGDKQVTLGVEKVISEIEVLVKPLRQPLARVRHIAGVTILGSGAVVPVLEVGDLIAAAQRLPVERPETRERRSVLVVEDSITSRMLLKNILESAGYRVRVAVDGLDGWNALQTEPVAVVVSDVDMPRLNGFELTGKIRGDAKLAALPVVLVTALDSPEARQRGSAAGANAYIVKSSFDQSNLLEVVRRLV
jgi:two-component system chemotaxis sensor kinase CheA